MTSPEPAAIFDFYQNKIRSILKNNNGPMEPKKLMMQLLSNQEIHNSQLELEDLERLLNKAMHWSMELGLVKSRHSFDLENLGVNTILYLPRQNPSDKVST